jgi:hypothetical protein
MCLTFSHSFLLLVMTLFIGCNTSVLYCSFLHGLSILSLILLYIFISVLISCFVFVSQVLFQPHNLQWGIHHVFFFFFFFLCLTCICILFQILLEVSHIPNAFVAWMVTSCLRSMHVVFTLTCPIVHS